MTADNQWLVNIFPKVAPPLGKRGEKTTQRENELVTLWSKYIEPVPEGGSEGDYENFIEQAYRLEAALSSFGPDKVWLRIVKREIKEAFLASTGERLPLSELSHLPRYGAQQESGGMHGYDIIEYERLSSDYMSYKTFYDNAGRRAHLAGFCSDENKIEDVIAGMNDDGINDFYVKFRKTKVGIFPLSIQPGASQREIHDVFMEEASWSIIHMEGDADTLLVQERVPMDYEYRLFVINHKVVTGAGCVEEFTPLDNDGSAFDPKMRRSRSMVSDVEEHPEVVDQYVAFGQKLAESFKKEAPSMTAYSMDVALGSDGKPLVIELNGALNSGFYACQPVLITNGMTSLES